MFSTLKSPLSVCSVGAALCVGVFHSLEASAASFTLTPAVTFEVIDGAAEGTFDGEGDPDAVFPGNFDTVVLGTTGETSQHAEFDLSSLLLDAPIHEALLQVTVAPNQVVGLGAPFQRPSALDVRGYVGNGQPDASDFQAGAVLGSAKIPTSFSDPLDLLIETETVSVRGRVLSFEVTDFLQQLVADEANFAGFSVRAQDLGATVLERGEFTPERPERAELGPRLLVMTSSAGSQGVPEPSLVLGLLGLVFVGREVRGVGRR